MNTFDFSVYGVWFSLRLLRVWATLAVTDCDVPLFETDKDFCLDFTNFRTSF
jgi:hypothetical protein